jgi:hypothetical protein
MGMDMAIGFRARGLSLLAVLAFAACLATSALAQEPTLKLVDDGKAVFTLVVPDGKDRFSMMAAAMLAEAAEKCSGAKMPIVEEKDEPAGPKVYVGLTRAAEKAGLKLKDLRGLACVLKVKDGNLFLAGHDRSKGIQAAAYYYTPASRRAVEVFLYDYAGVRWLWPNTQGLGAHFPTAKTISFPANLDRQWQPTFDWVESTGFREAAGYDCNTMYRSSMSYRSYGGHSYYDAVPKAKYAKDHPEYFALIQGVRNSAANHLCISNREVQDLLYAEMLKHIDAGFASVQLAQTDGYQPCQCPECQAIHPDIGERLWIVHNRLAQRLAKDRPEAKAVILAYGPTKNPPVTIERFGPNVLIELCNYTHAHFAKWRGKADGFMVYIYNWGSYHTMGFAPKTTPRMIADQVRFFRDQGVRGIYCCGLGESWGLEGPVYYVFNRCLNEPDAAWQKDLDEYYRAGFGRAYQPMKELYEAMFAQLDHYAASGNWLPLPEGAAAPGMPGDPETHYSYFFPPRLLNFMQARLDRAKELEPEGTVRKRVDFVERAFLYVRDIAVIFHHYRAYQCKPGWDTFEPLAEAIQAREERLQRFYKEGGGKAQFDGFPGMFQHHDIAFARDGGRSSGKLSAPVNWDVKALKEKKVLPGVGRKKLRATRADGPIQLDGALDEPVWGKAEVGEFVEIGLGRAEATTRVRLAYDDKSFYFAFECEEPLAEKLPGWWRQFGHDGALYAQDCVEIFLDPVGDLGQAYHFICSALPNSYYEEAFGLHKDPLHPLYNKDDRSWDGAWSYAGRIDAAGKRWFVEVAVPFATLGAPPPARGALWKMNLGRERFAQYIGADHGGDPELSLWSPNLEGRSFHSREAFGDVVFE